MYRKRQNACVSFERESGERRRKREEEEEEEEEGEKRGGGGGVEVGNGEDKLKS